MAGKMDALNNRAAARDLLDIDTAITSWSPGRQQGRLYESEMAPDLRRDGGI